MRFTSIEICAGGGGQALGLEMAGFDSIGAVEIEPQFCATLKKNRPNWNILQADAQQLDFRQFRGVDLVAAGVPCPPFSIAGKQLGAKDERDLFPAALRAIKEIKPRAVLLENVPGFAASKFEEYRTKLLGQLASLGYQPEWKILNASNFGVPQLRPRFVLVALRLGHSEYFDWPLASENSMTVGKVLSDLMAGNGWLGVRRWVERANKIAPTIVGGSKKHGGPDLGPTRAKNQWRELGVDGMGIADSAPDRKFSIQGMPKLTVQMVKRLQSFPDDWEFCGGKTIAYRQIGNAFPPLVARAVGLSLINALNKERPRFYDDLTVPHQLRLLEREVAWKTKKGPRRAQNS